MAYRRRQGITRSSTFKEEIYHQDTQTNANDGHDFSSPSLLSTSSSSLAAQAIRASAAHRDSSVSSAYGASSFHQSFKDRSQDSAAHEYTSIKSTNEPGGFWGVLARKAKSILDDDPDSQRFEAPNRIKSETYNNSTGDQPFYQSFQQFEGSRKLDNPRLQKGLDALSSSLNHLGNTIGNALEEGRTIVENKTADIIQETRKLQIRKKGVNYNEQNQGTGAYSSWQNPSMQTAQQLHAHPETQLKASRDVAMATAAKAKLLLRELKTVKADLAFAKERCSQLEDENKILREACEKGVNPEDDDMIRLQLETLLEEKGRLAHENSIYARENRFLREIVEYHQLTMQDVVYLDEGIEEVTEVYPIPAVSRMLSVSPPEPSSPRSTSSTLSRRSSVAKDVLPALFLQQVITDVPECEARPSSDCRLPTEKDSGQSKSSTS